MLTTAPSPRDVARGIGGSPRRAAGGAASVPAGSDGRWENVGAVPEKAAKSGKEGSQPTCRRGGSQGPARETSATCRVRRSRCTGKAAAKSTISVEKVEYAPARPRQGSPSIQRSALLGYVAHREG